MGSPESRTETFELLSSPFADVRVYGASLPSPVHDPCPLSTLALHHLWQQLRPTVRMDANSPALAALTGHPAATAARAFQIFGAALVRVKASYSLPPR